MAVTSTPGSEGHADGAEQPTRQLPTIGAGETCTNCGSQLRSDQRYCVNCGERRGRARFPVTELAGAAPAHAVTVTSVAPPPRRVWSGGATLVTGIATLLLAMGVGVLIGRTGQSNNNRSAAAPSVITVNGGGGTGTTAASTSSSGGTASKPSKNTTKANKKLPPKTVVVQAQAQAAKVLGGGNLPPATVKVGQKGSGPGFQGGKFTGQFFGP